MYLFSWDYIINYNENEDENKTQITQIQHKQIYNPGQNIWHKVRKSSKIGQEFRNLLSSLACFLTAIVKV